MEMMAKLGVSHWVSIKREKRNKIEDMVGSLLYFSLWIIQYKNKTTSKVKHFLHLLLFCSPTESAGHCLTAWCVSPQRMISSLQSYCQRRRDGSEVVRHPANRLDVGVFCLPLHVGAVASSLNDVHASTVVRLLIQHPAVWENGFKRNKRLKNPLQTCVKVCKNILLWLIFCLTYLPTQRKAQKRGCKHIYSLLSLRNSVSINHRPQAPPPMAVCVSVQETFESFRQIFCPI